MFRINLDSYEGHMKAAMASAEKGELDHVAANVKWAREKVETAFRLIEDEVMRSLERDKKPSDELV